MRSENEESLGPLDVQDSYSILTLVDRDYKNNNIVIRGSLDLDRGASSSSSSSSFLNCHPEVEECRRRRDH